MNRWPKRLAIVAVACLVGSLLALAAGAAIPGRDRSRTAAGTRGTVLPVAAVAKGPTGLRLVFSDEFSGPALDRGKWGTCYWWATSSGCTNSGNDELQWYVPGNVSLAGGALRLTAKQEAATGQGEGGRPQTFAYTSGMVSTADRFSFTYGYVEFRARIPRGRGLWPALWLLPADRSWPPEIDVFEAVGQNPTEAVLTYHRGRGDNSKRRLATPDLAAGWHTFAVDWRPGSITWIVDGEPAHSVTRGVADEPMYLLADLAVGGTMPGPPDATTAFPAAFEVDYVRVWQR